MRLAVLSLLLSAAALAQPSLLEQAQAAYQAGDLEQAAQLAQSAAARDPKSTYAHMILGIVSAQRSDWPSATRHFQTVVRLAPADPNGYFYLGQANLYQKQWAPAIRYFEQALQRGYPNRDRALVELAFAENEAGQPEKALAALHRIDGGPGEDLAAQYYAVAAFAQSRLGQFREAIASMRQARDREPGNTQHWTFLISTLIATDQTPAALREAIQAQALFPDNPDVQFLFALASYYVPESPLGPIALRNLQEAEPDSPRAKLADGLLLRKQGKNAEALVAFEEAARQGVPDSHLLLGILYRENGDAEAAGKEFLAAEKANPNSGQALLELGKLAVAHGDLPGALARLEKSARIIPDSPTVHYQLGLVYGRMGQREKAQFHLNQSRLLDKQMADLQRPSAR